MKVRYSIFSPSADQGISKYLSNVQNSITRYINIKLKQKGHIFLGQFKAVRMESDEQLLHVSRYVHLNPFTGYVVKTIAEARKFFWSSYNEYITNQRSICRQETLLSHFKSKAGYDKFIEDQKDYQRTLADIKHHTLE